MELSQITVDLEFTPNPNTLKYKTEAKLLDAATQNFPTPESAVGKAPLAEALYKIKDVAGVMIGREFVTITLGSQERLTDLNDEVILTIKKFIASGEAAVRPEHLAAVRPSNEKLSEIEQKIVEILDRDIRPAVAQDGGDITFQSFKDGVVFLHMQGSCAGCPSSTATLKQGIENRLKEAIPEVIEVVSV